jgi:acyl dehydratase
MSKVVSKDKLFSMVGEELGVSEWVVVDQTMIDTFADVTNDHQFIHTNRAKAIEAGFEDTIAHGMLTLSMIIGLSNSFRPTIEGVSMVINYGFDKIRFTNQVKVNSKIRARAILSEARERGGNILVKAKVKIEIDGENKPAIAAEWLTMHVISS